MFLAIIPGTASANIATYNITTLQGNGTGSITIDESTLGPLTPASLLAFSFSDTLQLYIYNIPPNSSAGYELSTFTRGLNDVEVFRGSVTGTPDNPSLSFFLATGFASGTNPLVGTSDLQLLYMYDNDSTGIADIEPPDYNLYFDIATRVGPLTLTPVSVTTPEPSFALLLGLGLLLLAVLRIRHGITLSNMAQMSLRDS